jgi:branched-subunit amino acid transport protein
MELSTACLLILGLSLTSFLPRASFILLLARWPVPDLVKRALRYVPAAVFSAILVPELVLTAGRLHLAFDNPRLLAGILAGAIAWRSRNTLLTIVAGMLALHLFGYLASGT